MEPGIFTANYNEISFEHNVPVLDIVVESPTKCSKNRNMIFTEKLTTIHRKTNHNTRCCYIFY